MPASRTHRASRSTSGLMPGISGIRITAGPEPAMYTAFTTPYFQGLYAAYVRMHYQKTWDGLLTSQVELPHVVWGEILWAGTLGMIFAALVCVALVLCGLVGLTSLVMAVFFTVYHWRRKGWAIGVAWAILLGVIVQGIMGGFRVTENSIPLN